VKNSVENYWILIVSWSFGRVSTTPGNLLEFKNPPGNLLEFNGRPGNFRLDTGNDFDNDDVSLCIEQCNITNVANAVVG